MTLRGPHRRQLNPGQLGSEKEGEWTTIHKEKHDKENTETGSFKQECFNMPEGERQALRKPTRPVPRALKSNAK